jgi:hypothetical protein
MKVDASRNTPSNIAHDDEYYRKIVERTSIANRKQKGKE